VYHHRHLAPCTVTVTQAAGCQAQAPPGDGPPSPAQAAAAASQARALLPRGLQITSTSQRRELFQLRRLLLPPWAPSCPSWSSMPLHARQPQVASAAAACSRLPRSQRILYHVLGPRRRTSELADCPEVGDRALELLSAVLKNTLPGLTTWRWQLVEPHLVCEPI